MASSKKSASWRDIWSGCEMMSPSPRPLRTVRTSRLVQRLKQSTYLKRRPAAVNLTVAHVVNQPQIDKVICAPVFLRNDMVHMKVLAVIQVLVADRTSALLPLGQLSPATGCPLRFRPSLSPVVL